MYQITKTGAIKRGDGVMIPLDPSNSDYIDYLDWVGQGNTAAPYVQPQEEIDEEARQAGLKAERVGLKGKDLDQAETWITNQLNGTTLDTVSKAKLLKIFKKFAAFILK